MTEVRHEVGHRVRQWRQGTGHNTVHLHSYTHRLTKPCLVCCHRAVMTP